MCTTDHDSIGQRPVAIRWFGILTPTCHHVTMFLCGQLSLVTPVRPTQPVSSPQNYLRRSDKEMQRRLFTLSIFAALLVGCAASAMRFGAPQTVDASLSQSRVKPDVVTGPCYKGNGHDCASTFHFVHDVQLEEVDNPGGCTNGSSCTLTPNIVFSGAATFANENFDCHGILLPQTSSISWYGVVLNFVALGSTTIGSGVDLGFRNETGSTIAYGAAVKVAYTCEGA
jgi:hypothetical protein